MYEIGKTWDEPSTAIDVKKKIMQLNAQTYFIIEKKGTTNWLIKKNAEKIFKECDYET